MFETIIRIAHERPVTADDFQPFVHCRNWMLYGEDNPDDATYVYDEAIYEFYLVRILNGNKVAILIPHPHATAIELRAFNDDPRTGVLMHLDADELAIRMDAS